DDAGELTGAVDTRVVDHLPVEEGDEACEAKNDLVNHPLVEVVDVELVGQHTMDEREALLHRRGTLAGTGPVEHRSGEASEHKHRRDDRHRYIEVERLGSF